MDFDRPRRFKAILLLVLVYVATSCLQSVILGCIDHPATSALLGLPKGSIPKPSKNSAGQSLEKARVYQRLKGDVSNPQDNEEEESDLVSRIYVELHTCLPRFICEVHAQPPGTVGAKTDLEKSILSLFKGHIFLEGPSSPVYSYQLAAHMGQLASGVVPSPCHSMYPSCPLSRQQLLELLSGSQAPRRQFL